MEPHLIERLTEANIPPVFFETKFDNAVPSQLFKKYIEGDEYRLDRGNGCGLNIHGLSASRVKLFPVIARAMSVIGDHVTYMASTTLRDVACHDGDDPHPLSERALTCSALFITNFAQDGECPFNVYERAIIEQFLIARSYSKRRNYFSSHEQLRACGWWSAGFVEDQLQFMRDVKI